MDQGDYHTPMMYEKQQQPQLHPIIPNLITNMSHNFYKTRICPHIALNVCHFTSKNATRDLHAISHIPRRNCATGLTYPRQSSAHFIPKLAIVPMEPIVLSRTACTNSTPLLTTTRPYYAENSK